MGKPENKAKLVSVLQYHVHAGKVLASGLAADSSTELATLETPKTLTVAKGADEKVTVNGNEVKTADQTASNGVVHIIEKVLVVPDDIVEKAQKTADLSNLVDALVA